ncbi:hypothetical protein [Thioalkalivibrio sp. ALE16]|uniref:hypothetical protein n=1 Tax=Thioalkalivibrio sp. ALE16 TaxID=1158172 RepID=UPI00037DB1DF|nr:hypothetical protein [Thioalkalivibrio sp. ALE16]
MTNEEKSLLLYMEARAVDHGGLIDARRMNEADMAIAQRWNESGFIRFGRLASESLPMPCGSAHWCSLSDDAWFHAHAERRARHARINARRTWRTRNEMIEDKEVSCPD